MVSGMRSPSAQVVRFIFALTAVVAVCFSSFPVAYAQTGPDAGTAGTGDESMLFQEIPTVYGASKYEQKVTEAPSSVSIVTANDIKKYGYRTLADILRSVRSFYITYDRNYDYAGVRGFNRPGDYNSRILLLVDGHRINDNIYDQALIGTEFVLDVDLIDRVEVIRGPGSSLYGSNAFFAVVNIITKRGRDLSGTEASGDTASYNSYKARVSHGTRYPGGTEVLLSGSFFESRGQKLYFPQFDQRLPDADPRAGNNGISNADADQSHNGFLKLAYEDITVTAAASSRTKEIPTGSFGTNFNDPRSKTVDAHNYLDVAYDHGLGRTDLTVRLFYDYYYYWGDYQYGDVTNKDRGSGIWWGTEVKAVTRFLDIHRLIAGVEYVDNLHQNQENYDAVPFNIFLDDKRSSYRDAIYVQDEIALSRALLLNIGGRYDHYSTVGDTTNPRLAVIFTPVERSTIKLLYGSAFRAPNMFELFYAAPTSVPPVIANPNLRPEKIKTTELIYEQYFGEHLRGTVGGFYYVINDLINQTLDANGNAVFENIAKVRAHGFEAELENRWASGLEGRLSYSYQVALDTDTRLILTNSPRQLAKLNVTVPIVRERLFAGAEEQYTASRTTLAGRNVGGYAVTNLTLLSRNLIDRLDISASVYNLFGRKYADPVSADIIQDSIQQDRTSYRLKVTYAF